MCDISRHDVGNEICIDTSLGICYLRRTRSLLWNGKMKLSLPGEISYVTTSVRKKIVTSPKGLELTAVRFELTPRRTSALN